MTRKTFLNNGCMKRYQRHNGYNLLTVLVKCAFTFFKLQGQCKYDSTFWPRQLTSLCTLFKSNHTYFGNKIRSQLLNWVCSYEKTFVVVKFFYFRNITSRRIWWGLPFCVNFLSVCPSQGLLNSVRKHDINIT